MGAPIRLSQGFAKHKHVVYAVFDFETEKRK